MFGDKKGEKKKTVETVAAAESESTTEPKKAAKKYKGIRGWSSLRALLKSNKCNDTQIDKVQEAMMKDPSLGQVTLEEYEDIKKDPSDFLSRI